MAEKQAKPRPRHRVSVRPVDMPENYHGDALHWLMETYNLSFIEAANVLADCYALWQLCRKWPTQP